MQGAFYTPYFQIINSVSMKKVAVPGTTYSSTFGGWGGAS